MCSHNKSEVFSVLYSSSFSLLIILSTENMFFPTYVMNKTSFHYLVYYHQQMPPDDTKRRDAQNIMGTLF